MNRRSFPAWVAMLAIALQAAWPLIAQARPQDRGHLVPLCSIDGVTHYVEIPAGKRPVERRSAAYHEHCQLCAFGVERFTAAPPSPLPPLRVAPAVLVVPVHAPSARFPVHFDSPAAARAPPAAS